MQVDFWYNFVFEKNSELKLKMSIFRQQLWYHLI